MLRIGSNNVVLNFSLITPFPEELLDMQNETVLGMYPREDNFYYYLPPESGNASCRLEVSNVLTPPLSPRRRVLPSAYKDEQDFLTRAAKTDRELIKQEDMVLKTREYYEMRKTQTTSNETFFPSDHHSLEHVRSVYKGVALLEKQVVSILYDRMKEDPCFSPIISRYDEMYDELAGNRTEKWLRLRDELIAEAQAKGGKTVSDSEVTRAYSRIQRQKHLRRHQVYLSYEFKSDSRIYCDGCYSRIPLKDFQVVGEYPQHFLIRKWVGDKEVSEISTDANRMNQRSW